MNNHRYQWVITVYSYGGALLERLRASTEAEHLKQLAFARQRYPENRLRITPPQWNGYKPPASRELNVPIPLDMLVPVARLATKDEVAKHRLAPAAHRDWRTAQPPVRQRPRNSAGLLRRLLGAIGLA